MNTCRTILFTFNTPTKKPPTVFNGQGVFIYLTFGLLLFFLNHIL